jgi:leucyl aminopeptidase (aminopeptidase T)
MPHERTQMSSSFCKNILFDEKVAVIFHTAVKRNESIAGNAVTT